MLKDSFRLYRFAQAQVANILDAKLPQNITVQNFYDLETKSGKRIDIKACKVRVSPKNRSAHYSLNHDRGGKSIKDRIDYLVCLAVDENENIVNALLIPAEELPDWETSINLSLSPHIVRRANRWYKFIVTLDELKSKLK